LRSGIQTFLSEAGESACYALDIIEISERFNGVHKDPVESLFYGISLGLIHYNERDPNDNDNFFVRDPAAFLSRLTGANWTAEKAEPNYKERPGEYIVERWERIRTGSVIGHFRLPDWDSLSDSQTVKYGKIASKRVFRQI